MDYREHLTQAQRNFLDLYGLRVLDVTFVPQGSPRTLVEVVNSRRKFARVTRAEGDTRVHIPVDLMLDADIETWMEATESLRGDGRMLVSSTMFGHVSILPKKVGEVSHG